MVPSTPALLDGERVLWRGTPPTGIRFYSHDAELIPFSILWTGFVAFWNVEVWREGNWPLEIWGAPFLIIGFYWLIARFFVDAWVRRRMQYFVTDRRIIIWRSGWRGNMKTVSLGLPPLLVMKERSNGSGDLRFDLLRFGRGRSGNKYEKGRWTPSLSAVPQFIGISNVALVRSLIEETAKLRSGGASST